MEFDGLQHYKDPERIQNDEIATRYYQSLGYKVVRIPFFIQLTQEAVKELFGVEVKEPLFDGSIPSFDVDHGITPAYLCGAGVLRMAKEFRRFPEQYKTNLGYLKKSGDEIITGSKLLETLYGICGSSRLMI